MMRNFLARQREHREARLAEEQRQLVEQERQHQEEKRRHAAAERSQQRFVTCLEADVIPHVDMNWPDGRSPFRMMKSETLVWACDAVYGQTGREYRAGSAGVSVRVAKGLYVRGGGTKGRTVDTPIRFTDAGTLGLTTKHIYFASSDAARGNAFRVRLDKLVSTRADADVVTFMRDLRSAKPEGFRVEHPRFINDVIATLSAKYADGTALTPESADADYPDEVGAALLALQDAWL